MHTKLWVVDQKHLYVGSANMDWRSLSQVNKKNVPSIMSLLSLQRTVDLYYSPV